MRISDDATIKQALDDLPGWSQVGDRLVKTFIRPLTHLRRPGLTP